MKKLLLLSIVMLSLFSCKVENKINQDNDAIVIIEESDEERPMFTVKLPDGRVLEHFFAEEIAQGLIDGKWKNNEDLVITETSEYQLFLEPDSMMIYSFGRKVAAVPYHKTGVLDSIFIADNE